MVNYHLEYIKASGAGQRDSEIRFINGINIIHGKSDSGKTVMANCIAYLMGNDDSCPGTLIKNGYDVITGGFIKGEFHITISRKLKSNEAEVTSDDPFIKTGIYPISDNSSDCDLNLIMLHMIGIDYVPKVASNALSNKIRMTWNALMRFLYLKKEIIVKDRDLWIDKKETKTYFLSLLLYLFYGQDFSFPDESMKPEIRNAIIQTKSELLIDQRANAEEKLNAARSRIDSMGEIPDINTVDECRRYLQEVNNLIDDTVRENKEYGRKIMQEERKLDELVLLKSRYRTLFEQYTADIERLDTIAQGQKNLFDYPDFSVCPVCGGELPQNVVNSYIDAAKAEFSKTVGLMKDLSKAINDVDARIEEKKKGIQELENKKIICRDVIEKSLEPKQVGFDQIVKKYEESVSLKKEIQMLSALVDYYDTELSSLSRNKKKKGDKKPSYKPMNHFKNDDLEELTKNAARIMDACGMKDSQRASFDISSGDIKIDGEYKSAFHGQGYSSLINSIVYLVFHEFCHLHAMFDPGFLIIDTPLLGLVDSLETDSPNEIYDRFYSYLANNKNINQIIILENMDHLPEFLYNIDNVKVHDFSENIRKGFLLDMSVYD